MMTVADVLEMGLANMSAEQRAEYNMFHEVRDEVEQIAGIEGLQGVTDHVLVVDHANSIHEHGIEAVTANNLQIIGLNVHKNKGNESRPRMGFDVQVSKVIAVLESETDLTQEQRTQIAGALEPLRIFF